MSALRANRSWNLLLTGGTISAVGDFVFDTTMVLWIGTVMQQVAAVVATAVAGLLASTALHGLHASFAGMTFGPYDTLFSVAGLLFIAGGLASIPLLRPAPGPAEAAEPEVTTTR